MINQLLNWVPCFAILVAVSAQTNTRQHSNWIKVLRQELFEQRGYDKNARPVNHHNSITEIDMQFSLTRVTINGQEGTLETNGWLALTWLDEMMTWEPSNYGQLQSLKLQSDELWKPDIVVYNSVRSYETLPGSHLVLLNNGIVYYIPPIHLTTACEYDLSHWPFDTQTCSLRFGAWSHDSTEILLGILDNQTEADMKHYDRGGSTWLVSATRAEVNSLQFDCCSPPYQDVVFTLQLERNSPFDAKMALAPATVVWLLVLITFWMKPQCPERIHVGCLAILVITIILIFLRLSLPSSSKSTPLIVIFHITLLALCAMAVLVTLMNSNLIRRNYPVPSWLFCLVQRRAGSLLCTASQHSLDSERALKTNEDGQSESESLSTMKIQSPTLAMHRSTRDRQSGWHLVATFIDRLAFLIYITIMTVIGLWYLLL